jgi:hypothetical protein
VGRLVYFRLVGAGFDWWLLIVGLVVGGGLVWYVLMDARRRDSDEDDVERRAEANWLAATMAEEGWQIPAGAAARALELHRAYLEAPPPDAFSESGPLTGPPEADPPAEPG